MSKDISLKSINLAPLLAKAKKYSRHAAFGAVIIVLLVYVLVVMKTSAFSKAEPTSDQVTTDTSTAIPRVNQQAVDRIQSLEDNNTVIKALFEQARNNPFQE